MVCKFPLNTLPLMALISENYRLSWKQANRRNIPFVMYLGTERVKFAMGVKKSVDPLQLQNEQQLT
jgi:hypothetical protein